MAIVETRRITKLFDEVRAVDGIDLIAKEGEFLVLLGPSGCGKTTLMRMIAGLERPTSGDIVIDGNIVHDLPPRARNSARDELKQFQRSLGTTTIYVTHDQAEAMGLGDRIAVLNQGRVRQIGTPHEIYGYPADIFAATFIGSPPMN